MKYLNCLSRKELWSIFSLLMLLHSSNYAQNLVSAEYFIDQDPGLGLGTTLTITEGVILDEPLTISIGMIPEGLHILGLRVKDENGLWSLFDRKNFIVQKLNFANVTAAEYFIDTDPGPGNANPIAITAGVNVDQPLSIMIPNLSEGMHLLGLRVRDENGLWSLFDRKNFIVQKLDFTDIVAVEFFLDTDPGVGAGIPVSFTVGSEIDDDLILMIPNDATVGYHEMGIRVKDSDGKWSLYEYRDIKICPVIDPDLQIVHTTCPMSADGEASVNPTGGDEPYEYLWSNGNTTSSITGLTPGTYYVTITDEDTCVTIITVQVNSNDVTVPMIVVNGDLTIDHCEGEAFVDPGVSASDNCDGDISANIITNNPVDVDVPGEYEITYNVSDASGNPAEEKTRTVIVHALPVVNCPDDIEVCLNDTPFNLTGANPFGGEYSGAGVDMGVFDPNIAGLGTHTIYYAFTDGNGCENNCSFLITVTSCAVITFSGKIIHQGNGSDGVKDVTTALSGDDTGTDLTIGDGLFSLIASNGDDFVITPTKTINLLNGVDVADATRISQHMGGNYITNFYRKVAADVNKSNSISTVDAALIKQVLLGNPSAIAIMTNTGSWRFVNSDFSPPGSTPFVVPTFPSTRIYTGASGDHTNQNFYGVKTGDVLNNADPLLLTAEPASDMIWKVYDVELIAGETIDLEFSVDAWRDISSFQFSFEFDPSVLQFEEIKLLQSIPDFNEKDNFGIHKVREGELRVVYTSTILTDLQNGIKVFKLRMKVLKSADKLSNVFFLSENILPPVVYNSDMSSAALKLIFTETVPSSNDDPSKDAQIILWQNKPNPFDIQTTIAFELPESMEASLNIYDASGRKLWVMKKFYLVGYHEELIKLNENLPAGVYFYELITEQGSLIKRMILMRE